MWADDDAPARCSSDAANWSAHTKSILSKHDYGEIPDTPSSFSLSLLLSLSFSFAFTLPTISVTNKKVEKL